MGTLLGLTAYLFAGALGLRDEGGVDGISCAASSTSSSSHNISQKRRFSPAPAKSMLGQQHQLSISRMLIPPPIPTILEEEDEDPPFLFGGYAGRRNGVDTLWIDGSGDSSGRWRSPLTSTYLIGFLYLYTIQKCSDGTYWKLYIAISVVYQYLISFAQQHSYGIDRR